MAKKKSVDVVVEDIKNPSKCLVDEENLLKSKKGQKSVEPIIKIKNITKKEDKIKHVETEKNTETQEPIAKEIKKEDDVKQKKNVSFDSETKKGEYGLLNSLMDNPDDLIEHFKKNKTTWVAFGISILLISDGNMVKGVFTLATMLFLVYYIHLEAHRERTWMTISHHYHHEHNNWLSHGIQILLEMHFGLFFPLLNQHVMGNILDKWVIIFLYLVYTTLHNINYSIYHINHTHELHHAEIMTNMGPDICDIIGGTKNPKNKGTDEYIEDTAHYIPNIIGCTIAILAAKFFYKNTACAMVMDTISWGLIAVVSIIVAFVNTYLYLFYRDGKIQFTLSPKKMDNPVFSYTEAELAGQDIESPLEKV